jgi:hypothetical protein
VVAGPPAHDSDPPGSETGIEGGKTIERPPLRMGEGFGALGRCAVRTAGLIATRRLHEPRTNVGRRVRWADGSTAAVYRETVADVTPTDTPTTLVVSFRPRGMRSERPPPPVPARERAQHDPVRGVPRVRVEAVVRERTARRLPRAVRLARPRLGRGVRPRAVLGPDCRDREDLNPLRRPARDRRDDLLKVPHLADDVAPTSPPHGGGRRDPTSSASRSDRWCEKRSPARSAHPTGEQQHRLPRSFCRASRDTSFGVIAVQRRLPVTRALWQPCLEHTFESLRHLRARALVLVLEVAMVWPIYVATQQNSIPPPRPLQAAHDQQFHVCR